MRDTSLLAWVEEQSSGRLNANETIVMDLFKQFPQGLSNFEVADLLHWSINRVTGRVNSLVKKGKLFEFRTKVNVHTRKLNIVWAAKELHPEWPLYHVTRKEVKENGEVRSGREVSEHQVSRA